MSDCTHRGESTLTRSRHTTTYKLIYHRHTPSCKRFWYFPIVKHRQLADMSQRQAFIGFAASVVSDTVSNSLRVVKTYRQVHEGDVGYCMFLY